MAAGRGVRLGDKTKALPKTLIPVGGKPLCHHIFDRFNAQPLQEIIVVTGFEAGLLQEALTGKAPRMEFVHNPDFLEGNLLTALAAESKITGAFALTNADHLFSDQILNCFFDAARRSPQISVLADRDRPLSDDDMKIALKPDGTVQKMSKKLEAFGAGYIGMTFVPEPKRGLYWETAHRTLKKHGRAVCVEEVINELAASGEAISLIDASGSSWIELDTPEDLARAQAILPQVIGGR